MKTLVGTSGWSYHWWGKEIFPGRKNFYDGKCTFFHYIEHFDAVEINCTFYRVPTVATVKKWKADAPRGFRYLIKVNKMLTHMKKLLEWEERFAEFHDIVGHLGKKLAGYLIQLPPVMSIKQLPRLLSVVKHNKEKYPNVDFFIEFRNPTWFCTEVYEALAGLANIVYVHSGYDLGCGPGGFYPPLDAPVINDKIMFRCHGSWSTVPYQGDYSEEDLCKIASMSPDLVFFDNTDSFQYEAGYTPIVGKKIMPLFTMFVDTILPSAVADAKRLQTLVS